VRAILDAAARVFATRGYAAGTTNHIALRAGVSIGSLYEYFPNKDALLVALMDDHLAAGEALLQATADDTLAADGDLRAAVTRFVHAMVALHARDRALHRVLFEEAPLPRRVRTRLADLERQVAGRVEAYLRRQRDLSLRDPALTAAIVVQTVEGLTHKLVVHGDAATDLAAYADEVVTLVVAYLTAPR
jgi:AcrR family transcriptional regulator